MGKHSYKVVKKPPVKKVKDNTNCFWCDAFLYKHQITKDHLIPKGMGGHECGKTVASCTNCNNERGRVTELYNHRLHLIRAIKRTPDRINQYKNAFKKKVQKLCDKVIKWEFLHRNKNIILPFSLLEIIKLDELVPL